MCVYVRRVSWPRDWVVGLGPWLTTLTRWQSWTRCFWSQWTCRRCAWSGPRSNSVGATCTLQSPTGPASLCWDHREHKAAESVHAARSRSCWSPRPEIRILRLKSMFLSIASRLNNLLDFSHDFIRITWRGGLHTPRESEGTRLDISSTFTNGVAAKREKRNPVVSTWIFW